MRRVTGQNAKPDSKPGQLPGDVASVAELVTKSATGKGERNTAGRAAQRAVPLLRPQPPLRLLLLRGLAWVATLSVLTGVGILIGFLLLRGLPVLDGSLFFGDTPPLQALLGQRPVWDGIWPACAGTFCLVTLTVVLALFPGVGCGVFLAEYASPAWRRQLSRAVDILAGTPSIVMGLFGFTLILFLRNSFWPEANTGLLLAALCLALLVLPVLIMTTREALAALPEELRLTTAALGFSQGRALRAVLLPAAQRGIWGGVILALGRAAEDTAVILLTGVVANAGLPAGLFGKFEALPFAIYYTAAQYQTEDELARGFGAALVLLCLAAGLLAAGRLLGRTVRMKNGKTETDATTATAERAEHAAGRGPHERF